MPKQMGLSRQRQDDQFSAWHPPSSPTAFCWAQSRTGR